jgi:ABC-type branched-subunit amino acid transport system substrate-binding protein
MSEDKANSDGSRINRRHYLAMTAAGVTALAGCSGGGGGGGGDEETDTDTDTPTESSGGGETTTMESGDSSGDTIPLASFCPLSGAGGAFGPGQQAGFNLAVEDMNSAGGILGGRQFNPINRNTETKPSRAASKLQTVISNENIEAFVGTWSSGVSATLAPIAADNEIMQMGNGTTSPTLASQGWVDTDDGQLKYMGRTSPNDGAQGIAMGGVLNDTIGADSAAFMHVDNPYGAGLARKASQAFDGETTAMVPVAKQTSDYSSALDEVFADDPDVFGLVVYPANGRSILKQWNRGGYGGTLLMSESMFLQDLFNDLSDIVADSYITTVRPNRNPSYEYFNGALQTRMDQDPTTFSHHSYDSAMLIGLAAHKAGEFTGTAIAQNIQSVSRPPGEEVFAGAEEFEKAKGLLDEGSQINYQGASSNANLNCFVEPYNRFSGNRLVQGDSGIDVERVTSIPADFFEGKLYTDDMLEKYNCN